MVFNNLHFLAANLFYSLLDLRKGYLDSSWEEDSRLRTREAILSEHEETELGIAVSVVAQALFPLRQMQSSSVHGLQQPHETISAGKDLFHQFNGVPPFAGACCDWQISYT